MNSLPKIYKLAALMVLAIWIGVGCAATPAEHSYVTNYGVVGEHSVKYIYLPGDESEAGGSALDQGLALELCDLEHVQVEVEEIDDEGEEAADGEEADDENEDSEGSKKAKKKPQMRTEIVESNCHETRILMTEEYR